MVSSKQQLVAGVLVGVVTAIVMGLHIYMSGESTTKLETTLFTIIEFILSLAFAWLLAGYTNKEAYRDSQRQFAISAYRRINEIDMSLERLLRRVRHQLTVAGPSIQHELEVLFAMATSTRETIKFSIADWADVIGEELKTLQKISRIRDAKARLQEDRQLTEPVTNGVISEPLEAPEEKQYEEEITRLVATLPPALALESEKEVESSYSQALSELRNERSETGGLTLKGFWESGFPKNVKDYQVGEKLMVSLSDSHQRTACLILRDPESNLAVGVVTNTALASKRYEEFAMAVVHCLGSSNFAVRITSIQPGSTPSGRIYFAMATERAASSMVSKSNSED